MNQNENLPPTRDDVIDAYRIMLGREPESDFMIAGHMKAESRRKMVEGFAASAEFQNRFKNAVQNPFWHVNASVDIEHIVKRFENAERKPRDGYYVNYLGVCVPIAVTSYLNDKSGQLDQVPIPSNYHADMAEWASVLRAIDLSKSHFTMIELGCGWGCWMANAGIPAKTHGRTIEVLGVEGDAHHIALAEFTMAANGISPDEYKLFRGIASAEAGYALFPKRKDNDEERWGNEPIFNASQEQNENAIQSGEYESLRMIPLSEIIGVRSRIDLLHVDIQGGEADLISGTLPLLCERVGYMFVGTHSRALEGRVIETLQKAGWKLEIERPAIFDIKGSNLCTTADGVQGWCNPIINS